MLEHLFNKLNDKEEEMIAIRRYLHENPELSFEEEQTAKYIADFYQDKDAIVETNIGGENIHGIKVTIDSGNPGKTLALRADFDALPIKEDTGLEFSSKNLAATLSHIVPSAFLKGTRVYLKNVALKRSLATTVILESFTPSARSS